MADETGLVPPVPGTVLEVKGCERCPFCYRDDVRWWCCRITETATTLGSTADWCPLLKGPVLVELVEESDG
jgi:hypothetical protein